MYIYTRRKDGAKGASLLDDFGHFYVPIFVAKAQVFDPRALILLYAGAQISNIRSQMLKPRLLISDLRW